MPDRQADELGAVAGTERLHRAVFVERHGPRRDAEQAGGLWHGVTCGEKTHDFVLAAGQARAFPRRTKSASPLRHPEHARRQCGIESRVVGQPFQVGGELPGSQARLVRMPQVIALHDPRMLRRDNGAGHRPKGQAVPPPPDQRGKGSANFASAIRASSVSAPRNASRACFSFSVRFSRRGVPSGPRSAGERFGLSRTPVS